MKDITKRDILDILEQAPAAITKHKYNIAQTMLPSIQNYSGGVGSALWENDKLYLEIRIGRTNKQRRGAIATEIYEEEHEKENLRR